MNISREEIATIATAAAEKTISDRPTKTGVLGFIDKFSVPTMIAGLIAIVVWAQNIQSTQQSNRDAQDGLAHTMQQHQNISAHPGAEKRLTEIETHFQYIREDLGEIKSLIATRFGNNNDIQ